MYSTGSKEIRLWRDGKSQDMSGKKHKKMNDDEESEEEVSAVSKRTKSASAEQKELEEEIHKLQSWLWAIPTVDKDAQE